MKQILTSDASSRHRMKAGHCAGTGSRWRRRLWLRAALCAAGCLISRQVGAQGFNLDWSAVAAGGGTSGGGDYVLTAMVGQPFGGETSGVNYGMETDFAGLVENVEPATPPVLRIARAGAGLVVVAWPASATGWVLQQASVASAAGDWTDVNVRVLVNGADNTATLPLVAGNRFYRLRHP